MQTFSSQSPYCEMFVLAIREREERYKVQSISQLICNYFCGALLMQNKISFCERLLSFCIKILSNLRTLRRIIILLKLNPVPRASILFLQCFLGTAIKFSLADIAGKKSLVPWYYCINLYWILKLIFIPYPQIREQLEACLRLVEIHWDFLSNHKLIVSWVGVLRANAMSITILFQADHSDWSQSWNKMNPSEYFYQSLTNCIHLNFSDKRIRKTKIGWLQKGNELLLILLTHLLSSRCWQIIDWAFHTHYYFFEESFLKMFLMKTPFSIFAIKRNVINKFGCSWFSWWVQCPWRLSDSLCEFNTTQLIVAI